MPNDEKSFQKSQLSQRDKVNALKTLATKIKPGLAVDTDVSRYKGRTPQQVFPYETRTGAGQPLVRGVGSGSVKHRLDYRLPFRMPFHGQSADIEKHHQSRPLHKRIDGLRPSPLDLHKDISPSDRAIPIGFSLSSTSLPATQRNETFNDPPLATQESLHNDGGITPTIILTPARDDLDSIKSPYDLRIDRQARSLPVACLRSSKCPPGGGGSNRMPQVHPLPLAPEPQLTRSLQNSHSSEMTVIEENDKHCSRNAALSVCTSFDGMSPLPPSATCTEPQHFRQSHLPTPLRSRGWWNIVTSPFSAKSTGIFWRSSRCIEEREPMKPIMSDMSTMGSSSPPLYGRIDGDNELRSAPPDHADRTTFDKVQREMKLPKRSFTAPGILKSCVSSINIYWTPDRGEASSYYDRNRHFSSLTIRRPESDLSRGASAAETLPACQRNEATLHALCSAVDSDTMPPTCPKGQSPCSRAPKPRYGSINGDSISEDPFGDFDQDTAALPDSNIHSTSPDNLSSTKTEEGGSSNIPTDANMNGISRAIFTSPAAEELATPPTYVAPAHGDRNPSKNEHSQQFASSFSDRVQNRDFAEQAGISGKRPQTEVEYHHKITRNIRPDNWHPVHARKDSQGLGITNNCAPYHPPAETSPEKVMLATDRYGQLTMRSFDQIKEQHRPWYERFFWPLAFCIALLLMLLIVMLAVFVPQKHHDAPVQQQWLNLAGFPALPTGVATVIQPKNMESQNGCIEPSSVWSCDAPVDAQGLGGRDLPKFRFEIRFRNHTTSNSTALELDSNERMRRSNHAEMAARIPSMTTRDTWRSHLVQSFPDPPSENDRLFIGNTTDNNAYPYNGEETPFFISLLDALVLEGSTTTQLSASAQKFKRDDTRPQYEFPYPTSSSYVATAPANTDESSSSSPGTAATGSELFTFGSIVSAAGVAGSTSSSTSVVPTSSFLSADVTASKSSPSLAPTAIETSSTVLSSVATDPPKSIPQPAKHRDGRPDDEVLYPYAGSQPVRLYNRGRDDEHYGFYTYFDRSLYLSGLNSSSPRSQVALEEASAVCVWSQTRLHVQLWTRKGTIASLNASSYTNVAASNSSANVMTAPGSFPYPVTITIDRHGGEADRKGVYCYGLDEGHRIVKSKKMWVAENRAYGGSLVNPAQIPTVNGTTFVERDGGERTALGGIDGGTGGCACQWSTTNA